MKKASLGVRPASQDQLKRATAFAALQIALLGVIVARHPLGQTPVSTTFVALPSSPSPTNLAAHVFPLATPTSPLLAIAGAAASSNRAAAYSQIAALPASPFKQDDAALDDDFDAAPGDRPATPGILQFGPMRVPVHVAQNVVAAAHKTGSDPVLLMAIADKESAFSTTVKARTSSASGLFQFIGKTWLNAFHSFAELHSQSAALKTVAGAGGEINFSSLKPSKILQMRNDPYLSAAFAGEMLKRDRKEIAGQIGRDLTSGETYLIHFLGKDDASRFMRALETNPGAPAARLLPRPARANRPIFYEARRAKTVHEVHQAFETMMRTREDRYRDIAKQLPNGVSAYSPVE